MFDAKLKEGVEYFEQMLKVMPEDRTALEFLAVAYLQNGEEEKAGSVLSSLARVVLKEGDYESAAALLPRLEASSSSEARAIALKIKAMSAPRPELKPESPSAEEAPVAAASPISAAKASEAELAEKLNDKELADHLRALPDNGRVYLVSALSTLEKEKADAFEQALANLADEFGEVPIPLDAFEPDRRKAAALGEELVKRRGVIPFAALGDLTLVAYLSPHDSALKREVMGCLGGKVRFYLAEPRLVEAAIAKLFGE